jgi:nicotinamidase-related amidase
MEIDNELRGILDPAKTALLVWDVQNMLVNRIFNPEQFLASTKNILASAKARSVPVIFSKITPLSRPFESPVRNYFFRKRQFQANQIPNGFDLTIEPTEGDIVMPKNTASIFIGTNFEMLLRNAGITTILFTGIATEFGVESSARDASNRGFFPVILTDAVSSYDQEAHNRSLQNMKNLAIELTTEEVIALWE